MDAKSLKRLDAKLNDIYDEIEQGNMGQEHYHELRAIIGILDALQIIKKELAANGEPISGQPSTAQVERAPLDDHHS